MKKLLTLSVILILSFVSAKGQACPDSLYLFNQAQIDSFLILYPNCTGIAGDVCITGDDIISLNGLVNLTSVGGDLWIDENPILTNLSGLENVNAIGGDLWVKSNDTLTSISGLEKVTSIGGGLWIIHNVYLPSLEGLEELTSVGNYLRITNNDVLTNLSGLDNVTSIGGILFIGYNDDLINLSGLEGLTFVGGNLWITYNFSLTSLSGLNNLTFVGGHLAIGFGYTHGGDGNYSLMNLTGLEGLTSIGGGLWISGNFSLTTLTGLDNIESSTIEDLYIDGNSSLSTCEVQSVCDYLASPSGNTQIQSNATGCNSPEEVEDACEAVSVEEMFLADDLMIYPNPANQIVRVSLEGLEFEEVSVYTLTGQLVLHARPEGNIIDISHLHPGLYIVEVIVEGTKVRQKLLVQ